jgi:hypothetical protein
VGLGQEGGESLQSSVAGDITNVCFWGFWLDFNGVQVAGPADQGVDVTYYTNDGGFPGTQVATFRAGTPGVTVVNRGTDFSVTHPAFHVNAGQCYFVSISYQSDANNPARAFRFLWGETNQNAAFPSTDNTLFFRTNVNNPTPGCWAGASPDLSFIPNIGPGQTPACTPPPPPPPANDLCANATAITGSGNFAFDNRSAGTEGSASCADSSRDVFYSWTPPCAGDFVFSTCGNCSAGDTVLAVLSGGCGGTEIACNDDDAVCAPQSSLTFTAAVGQTYILRVAQFGAGAIGAASNFSLNRVGGNCGGGCPCDFNMSGELNSQDFFDFLNAFFALDPRADFNHSGAVNSQDFFDFLNCFFTPPAGC